MILLITVSFISNASYAVVRARRREVRTLACLGWFPAWIFRAVLGELALTGTAAGLLGAAVSAALIAALHLHLCNTRVLLVPLRRPGADPHARCAGPARTGSAAGRRRCCPD